MSKQAYDALQADLLQVEKATGLYLADENVDAENVTVSRDSDEFWTEMLWAAKSAAGQRAEAAGQDINQLLGYIIY